MSIQKQETTRGDTVSIELKALKIDSTDKGVTGLPDTPALTTEQMQAKFDELPLLCVKQINNIVDDLLELKTAITKAVGVVIPETTALLRGDGEGGAQAAELDTEPTKDSTNPISSGAVYTAMEILQNIPTDNSVTPESDTTIVLSDNNIYDIELGAYALTLDVSEVTGCIGAHVLLYITSASATLTISGASLAFGDSLDDMGASQHWELSVYKQQVIIKNVTA